MLIDLQDGDPPPAFNVNVLHELSYDLTFSGDHVLQPGDVVRFVPLSVGDCLGAASADSSTYGGALDGELSTTVSLPGGVDGTDSGIYVLCLKEGGSDFVLHSHVTVTVYDDGNYPVDDAIARARAPLGARDASTGLHGESARYFGKSDSRRIPITVRPVNDAPLLGLPADAEVEGDGAILYTHERGGGRLTGARRSIVADALIEREHGEGHCHVGEGRVPRLHPPCCGANGRR